MITKKLFRKECECGYIGAYTTMISLPAGDLKYYVCPMCKKQLKPISSVWVCLDGLKKEIDIRMNKKPNLKGTKEYKEGWEDGLLGLYSDLGLCNSQEQKKTEQFSDTSLCTGVSDVGVETESFRTEPRKSLYSEDVVKQSSVSCEHKTGEDECVSMSTRNEESNTLSAEKSANDCALRSSAKSSPVQNPKQCAECGGSGELECDEEGTMYAYPKKCPDCKGTGINPFSIPKKCTCKNPDRIGNEILRIPEYCGRCGGVL